MKRLIPVLLFLPMLVGVGCQRDTGTMAYLRQIQTWDKQWESTVYDSATGLLRDLHYPAYDTLIDKLEEIGPPTKETRIRVYERCLIDLNYDDYLECHKDFIKSAREWQDIDKAEQQNPEPCSDAIEENRPCSPKYVLARSIFRYSDERLREIRTHWEYVYKYEYELP